MKKTEKERLKALSAYTFDTSNYIILNPLIKRDAQTGRLVKTTQQSK